MSDEIITRARSIGARAKQAHLPRSPQHSIFLQQLVKEHGGLTNRALRLRLYVEYFRGYDGR